MTSYNKNQKNSTHQNGYDNLSQTEPIIDTVKLIDEQPEILRLDNVSKRSITNGPRFEKLRKEIDNLEEISSGYIVNKDSYDDSNDVSNSIASNNSQTIRISKVSDLKRSQQHKSNSIKLNSIRNLDFDNDFADISNISSAASTIPRNFRSPIHNTPEDFDMLMSTTSSIPETDIDSGIQTPNRQIRQTNLYNSGIGPNRCKSLSDINRSHKPSNETDNSFISNNLYRAKSEDLRSKESVLVNRLKSKAQSKTELRIAESLTKLNIPEWMDNYRYTSKTKSSLYDSLVNLKQSQSTRDIYSSLQRSTPRMNSLKMSSTLTKTNRSSLVSSVSTKTTPYQLPSKIYRSKSQILQLFNPEEDSKLKQTHKSLLRIEKIDLIKPKISKKVEAEPSKPKEVSLKPLVTEVEHIKTRVEEKPKEVLTKPLITDDNLKNMENYTEMIQQSKVENNYLIQLLIHNNQENTPVNESICKAFSINHATLRLLMNVKRKTPNLNRETNLLKDGISNKASTNQQQCNNKRCNEQLNFNFPKNLCSCYNCFTYYCSKKCRNYSFTSHTSVCKYNRIQQTLNQLSTSLNYEQCTNLFEYSYEQFRTTYKKGIILIAFESSRAADDFINGQANRLISQPVYVQLDKLEEWNFYNRYNPYTEFQVCFMICATLPMMDLKYVYPTFRLIEKFYRPESKVQNKVPTVSNTSSIHVIDAEKSKTDVEIINHINSNNNNDNIKNNDKNNNNNNNIPNNINTENSKVPNIKNSLHSHSKTTNIDDKDNQKTNELTRTNYVKYVLNFFQKRNIDLPITHPKIYKKLENYSYHGIVFPTISLYYKDPIIKSTVECLIVPDRDIISKPVKTVVPFSQNLSMQKRRNSMKFNEETEI